MGKTKRYKTNKMAGMNTHLSVITLNVNDPNSPNQKTYMSRAWSRSHPFLLPRDTSPQQTDISIGWRRKGEFQGDGCNKHDLSILIPDKTDCQPKLVIKSPLHTDQRNPSPRQYCGSKRCPKHRCMQFIKQERLYVKFQIDPKAMVVVTSIFHFHQLTGHPNQK